jgi:2,3-bisphosphoglycerate-dependent phosphoglycerate mutase
VERGEPLHRLLTEVGRAEANRAGRLLAQDGCHVDRAFASTLRRAVDTGRIVLDALDQTHLEQIQAWELNERFYGALTGRDKHQTAEEFGEAQVHVWRRSYATAPPGGESLKDTGDRTIPYFEGVVLPATREVATVLVCAHGNSLRSIIKELDGLSDEAITGLEIATGIPVIYDLEDAKVVDRRVLTD